MNYRTPPTTTQLRPQTGLLALRAMRRGFSGILPVLEIVWRELGDIFQLILPGFSPVFVAQPEAIRQVLVEQRDAFLWRLPQDPVTRLLRRGLLVTDGEDHRTLRAIIDPSSHRQHFAPRSEHIWRVCDRVLDQWQSGCTYDMLMEMRKLALLIFEHVYFSHDLLPELDTIWQPMLTTLDYIGPGWWVLFRANNPPRESHILDEHLYALIRQRRAQPGPPDDLLTHLVQHLEDDGLVRDQMLTMLIAGHDTSTAHLAWTLYLLGKHPHWLDQVQNEVRQKLGAYPPVPENVAHLHILDQVIRESLRLYPPIHVGSRLAIRDVELGGFRLPAGTRVMLSYYLVQRHPDYWEAPDNFQPQRWAEGFRPAPFTYLPFGGGPRNCIGASFAQLEVRLVLARLLQRFQLSLRSHLVSPHMGATLEPHPTVNMQVWAIS